MQTQEGAVMTESQRERIQRAAKEWALSVLDDYEYPRCEHRGFEAGAEFALNMLEEYGRFCKSPKHEDWQRDSESSGV
jgi:hypothetical protein